MPDPAAAMAASGTVLAFDFGLRRIGVALGETLLGQARALMVIDSERNDVRFSTIQRLIAEWQPVGLVVGLPCAVDGSEHEMTARCRTFARQLEERYRLPVCFVDERFSSTEADARLAGDALNWRERRKQLDAVAAQIILQDYFDTHSLSPAA